MQANFTFVDSSRKLYNPIFSPYCSGGNAATARVVTYGGLAMIRSYRLAGISLNRSDSRSVMRWASNVLIQNKGRVSS